jgi:mono/diheme cytochrome c family protein
LSTQAHSFSDGATLNQLSTTSLVAIIGHGGVALGKSPEMPPYSPTLSASDIDALVAYLRAIADPPYRPQGVFYANQ